MNRKKAAVFLDRDGVINKKSPPHDYVKKWKEFEFLPGVFKAIRELNKKFLVIIITNQRGVGRGLISLADLENIHAKMIKKLRRFGAKIDGIYICPHDIKDNCDCRKPKSGMLFRAAKDFKIDFSQSYIIGDSSIDIQAGKKVGSKTVLINSPKSCFFSESKKEVDSDYITSDLLEMEEII